VKKRTYQITFNWNFIAKTGIPDSFLRRHDNTSQQAVSFQTPPQIVYLDSLAKSGDRLQISKHL